MIITSFIENGKTILQKKCVPSFIYEFHKKFSIQMLVSHPHTLRRLYVVYMEKLLL